MTLGSPPPAPAELSAELPRKIQILFVCSGNTCRSPMAEGFCRQILMDGSKYRVISAGTSATNGERATPEAIAALLSKGIDISQHSSQILTADLIRESSFIFVMGERHRQKVLELCPEASGKCFLLAENSDIADPFEEGQEVYNKCATQISDLVQTRVKEILPS